MARKRDWLDAGLTIVAQDGARALTIERLMGMLELSKGSFYHHFKGMPAYVAELAALFEAEHTTRFISAVEQQGPDAPGKVKVQRLIEAVDADWSGPELEINMRAWGQQDAVVGAMMARVDAVRTDYLRTLCRAIASDAGGDAALASDVAELLCLIYVGGLHVFPSLAPERVRRHSQFALNLLPGWEA